MGLRITKRTTIGAIATLFFLLISGLVVGRMLAPAGTAATAVTGQQETSGPNAGGDTPKGTVPIFADANRPENGTVPFQAWEGIDGKATVLSPSSPFARPPVPSLSEFDDRHNSPGDLRQTASALLPALPIPAEEPGFVVAGEANPRGAADGRPLELIVPRDTADLPIDRTTLRPETEFQR